MRPKISEDGSRRLTVGLSHDMIDRIDYWRGRAPGVPARSDAIRLLIAKGLEAQAASDAAA
ncbi:hypothetical protein GCM10011317_48450 [Niveispirillum cyanobacteriorum]|nr:hypothetical protein GCM10011317_48450 [Niveispirillum cyanobacteriorum]